VSFTIDIQDRATPAVEGALSELQLAGVKPAIGRAVVRLVQQHFLRLNASRANPLGGPRSNFYAQAARNTRYDVQTDGVLVSVGQVGIRQRLEGGEMVPRNVKYLTLPAIAEAYGKRTREFPNLAIMWRRLAGQTRPVALVEAEATPPTRLPAHRRAGGQVRQDGPPASRWAGTRGIQTNSVGGKIFFWLVKSVTQPADPSVLPSERELTEAAVTASGDYFDRLLRRGGADHEL